jgi:murein DD-endopeptidase MepM/ murein hydrolase activator NlpD
MINAMRKVRAVLILIVLAAAGVYIGAGYLAGPAVTIVSPDTFVGASTPLQVTIDAPGGRLSSLSIAIDQHGKATSLVDARGATASQFARTLQLHRDGPNRVSLARQIGKATMPDLTSGPATLTVTASRPVLWNLRRVRTVVTRELTVRLEPPRVYVLSTQHYINLGGSEMVVYRVTPDDVMSGVRVGGIEYPGFPASGATVEGIHLTDPSMRVAFFALLYDQDVNTPMEVYARDPAGNSTGVALDHRAFPRTFRQSRIVLDDTFLDRVVPAILAGTTAVTPEGSTIDKYVVLNRDLRKKNAETIASFAAKTAPEMLWGGTAFHAFGNTAVESAFADHRTYVYQGRVVDHEVHLGFDLASVAHARVVAANRGRVLFAGNLGIYGNCVIIDHGMGVQSLYGHLSSISVKPGDMVAKDQEIGRSGMTGLAGGDHLHFTVLVNGHMVNPIEWWDPHWIHDRILRKLQTAQGGAG